MQIDFHHAVTYVVARLAKFTHAEASTIAYCAQYVDDAVNYGEIKFDDRSLYYHISSAHKMIDIRNSESLPDHEVWIPFHFLPGNEFSQDTFFQKIICRENSAIAQDMVKDCIREKSKRYGLHRLGITMHVYADTWAHQGFSGIINAVNVAKDVGVDYRGEGDAAKSFLSKLSGLIINNVMPLGHGAVSVYPDLPFLVWSYTNWKGEIVNAVNPSRFLDATDNMFIAMQRYIQGDPDAHVSGLPPGKDKDFIAEMFNDTVDIDGENRHKAWLKAIKDGKFSFGSAEPQYVSEGENSWEAQALTRAPVDVDSADTGHYECVYKTTESFLKSDWKLFHDALQAHRFKILHEILPEYGICAA